MNTALLLRVRDAILAEPAAFDMTGWFTESEQSSCGTAACIGGWTVALGSDWPDLTQGQLQKYIWAEFGGRYITHEQAKTLLDLDEDAACRLFYLDEDWPEDFREAYAGALTPETRAAVAARRIDHFIATGGEE